MWLTVWLKRAGVQQYPHKVRNLHIDGGEMSYHVDDGLDALEPAGGVPVTQFCLCRHGIIGINGDKHSQYHLWDLLGPGG